MTSSDAAASLPFDLRQLRQFVVLAEECHYGRAAARLHMTQPPLTQAIQRLEAGLGVRLFDRSPRRVVLEPAGLALLPLARRLLATAASMPAEVRDAAAGLAGSVRLAFVSSIAYGPLPGWLGSFRMACPGIALTLQEATMDVQLERFAAGEIDAGFLLHAPEAPPAVGRRLTVMDEPLVLALPEGHRALERAVPPRSRVPGDALPAVPWRSIADEPLVLFPRRIAPSLFDAIASAYRASGRSMVVAQEAIQMQTIVSLVSAGMGVAWVPASLTGLQRAGVRHARVTGVPGPALAARTSLAWAADAPPAVERFIAHVRAALPPRLRRQSAED